MGVLERAKAEAVERIRQANDKSQNGLIIWRTAQEYGLECRTLAKAMAGGHKEEVKETAKNMPLDYLKIEQLVKERGISINDFAELCGRGRGYFDDLREGRTKKVRASTYMEIARRLGVPVEEIALKPEQTLPVKQAPSVERIPIIEFLEGDSLTSEERKLIKVLAIWNGLTEDEVKTRIIKRFLLDADTSITTL